MSKNPLVFHDRTVFLGSTCPKIPWFLRGLLRPQDFGSEVVQNPVMICSHTKLQKYYLVVVNDANSFTYDDYLSYSITYKSLCSSSSLRAACLCASSSSGLDWLGHISRLSFPLSSHDHNRKLEICLPHGYFVLACPKNEEGRTGAEAQTDTIRIDRRRQKSDNLTTLGRDGQAKTQTKRPPNSKDHNLQSLKTNRQNDETTNCR